jgi:lysine/ornithine N-monooxygenase
MNTVGNNMNTIDVFGMGAGPANLSLAALALKTQLNMYFCDIQQQLVWHIVSYSEIITNRIILG